jgi:hypothetical protein
MSHQGKKLEIEVAGRIEKRYTIIKYIKWFALKGPKRNDSLLN